MDLYAYSQMDELAHLLTINNINIPRLRGIRLMSEETMTPEEEVWEITQHIEIDAVKDLVSSVPFWNPNSNLHFYGYKNKRLYKKYLGSTRSEMFSVQWDKIHGKKRKILKFLIKKNIRDTERQYYTFNKYVGEKNVLYVHARVGGRNWHTYGCEQLEKEPWFIEKVDDAYDSTYCDIYCRIKEA